MSGMMGIVMVNFMWKLGWAFGVCLRGFADKITIPTGRLFKGDCPALCGCALSHPLRVW